VESLAPTPVPASAAPKEAPAPVPAETPASAPEASGAPSVPPATQESQPTPEQTAVISDLHWLIHQGHVIEFANGVLETAKKPLPKPPKPEPKPKAVPATASADQAGAVPAVSSETTSETAVEHAAEIPADTLQTGKETELAKPEASVPAVETAAAADVPMASEPAVTPTAAAPATETGLSGAPAEHSEESKEPPPAP
jgi:hypothetical protein